MADISFYKYLEAAFRHKLFNPEGQRAAFNTSFNYLNYNLTYDRIFFDARRVFPAFYNNSFPNTEEGNLQMARDILQKLDLHKDPALDKYFNPATAPEENEQIIQEAKIASTAAPTEEPESYAPPPPVPVIPKKIIILNPQEESTQTETEVETEMETQPASTGPTQTESPQEASMPPQSSGMPQPPSMSFSTGLGGGGAPPRKKGGMEGGTGQGTAATNKIDRLNKPPSMKKEKKRWFGRLRPKESSNFLNLLDNPLVDKLGGWLYRNAIKPLAQWLGRNVLQPLARLAAQAVTRLLWPLITRLAAGALSGLLSLLGGISLGGLFAAALPWIAIIATVALVVAVIFTAFQGFQEIQFPSKEPVQLDYTLPLRNPNAVPQDPQSIKTQIQESWPGAKIQVGEVDNWQKIIDAAVANNWNPALLLTLWIEASGAQGKTGYLDPLGCDPDSKHPKDNLDLSLQCIFGKFGTFKDNQFPDFIKIYAEQNNYIKAGSSVTYYNAGFLQEIRYWYTQMIPDGEWAIKEISLGEASRISGCPVTGIITNPYGYNLPDYPYKNIDCKGYDNCHNGIDIAADIGTDIKSPMIGTALKGEDNEQGKYVVISTGESTLNSEIFITFDHLSEYAPKFADRPFIAVGRGDIIGKTGNGGESTGPHLHYRINKGVDVQNPFVYLKNSATTDPDVLTSEADISKNNYAQIRHEPGSITNNWGTCDTLPSP